ncbi:MAG TPA: hypothetical protein VLK85_04420 [Ramlibacter sp.]|nr:hypothetical protein [Ramlibacter sp.]
MHAFIVPTWLYVAFLIALTLLVIAITLSVRDRRPPTRVREAVRVLCVVISGAVTLVSAFGIWLLRGLGAP